MKTLHTAYRARDLERSLNFYTEVGFLEVGRVPVADGAVLVMLRLPDDDMVSLELVSRPSTDAVDVGTGFSHIAVQVEDLDATLVRLAASGIDVEGPELPDGPGGPKTAFLHDPDGYRIELVEWPPGHADGITDADFA
jgi:lactoylglutathione lyase